MRATLTLVSTILVQCTHTLTRHTLCALVLLIVVLRLSIVSVSLRKYGRQKSILPQQ